MSYDTKKGILTGEWACFETRWEYSTSGRKVQHISYTSVAACLHVCREDGVLNRLLCLSVLCGSLSFFTGEQCFTAYSSSRGLISLQSLDGLCKPGAFSCTIYSCETGLRSWCLHHENTVLHSHWRLQGLSSGRVRTQPHTELRAIHTLCRGR